MLNPEFIKKQDFIQDHFLINHKKITRECNEKALCKLYNVYQNLYLELKNHACFKQCNLLKNYLDLCPEYAYHYILSFNKFDVTLTISSKYLNLLVVEYFLTERYFDITCENFEKTKLPNKTCNYKVDIYGNLGENDMREILKQIESLQNAK